MRREHFSVRQTRTIYDPFLGPWTTFLASISFLEVQAFSNIFQESVPGPAEALEAEYLLELSITSPEMVCLEFTIGSKHRLPVEESKRRDVEFYPML